jgi:hypothetical protein
MAQVHLQFHVCRVESAFTLHRMLAGTVVENNPFHFRSRNSHQPRITNAIGDIRQLKPIVYPFQDA